MKNIKRIVFVLLLVLIFATPAKAVTVDNQTGDAQISAWIQVAESHWSQTPYQCNTVVVTVAQIMPEPATWAATTLNGCVIWLDPEFYPYNYQYSMGKNVWDAEMCSVVVHEWGHILGFPHSNNPYDVMYPSAPQNVIDGCPRNWGNGKLISLKRDSVNVRSHRKMRSGTKVKF